MANRKGIALIVVIIIIVVSAIASLAIASAISNATMLTAMRVFREKALYAAEAGAYEIIRAYRALSPYASPSSHLATIRDRNIKWTLNMQFNYPDITYSAYTTPDYVSINASNPRIWRGAYYTIDNILLSNWSRYTWYADYLKVEWSNMTNTMRALSWGGIFQFGTFTSGQEIALSPRIQIAAAYKNFPFGLYFQNDIPANASITMTFYCPSGAWPRRAILLDNGYAGNNEFQITSTGKAATARGTVKRTIRATYDVGTNKITSWQETNTHL